MMRNFFIFIIFLSIVPSFLSAQTFHTPFSAQLRSKIAEKIWLPINPAAARLQYLRYIIPSQEVRQEPGLSSFWANDKDEHTRALAIYLYNMYVSTAVYNEDVPPAITMDYLGVLDGIAKLGTCPLDVREAISFYNENKADIKVLLARYFRSHKLYYNMLDQRNDVRELAFLQLLTKTPKRGKVPYYTFPRAVRLGRGQSMELVQFITRHLRSSIQEGSSVVVTYKESDLKMEELDYRFKPVRGGMKTYYRYAKDECEYSSYLLGRKLWEAASRQERPDHLRVYTLTARPVEGEYLKSSQGDRFKLASGNWSARWHYHTAILVVARSQKGAFTATVADTFLNKEYTTSLSEWLGHFAQNKTLFKVMPFQKMEVVEEALKRPDFSRGRNVVIDGVEYEPYPVGS